MKILASIAWRFFGAVLLIGALWLFGLSEQPSVKRNVLTAYGAMACAGGLAAVGIGLILGKLPSKPKL